MFSEPELQNVPMPVQMYRPGLLCVLVLLKHMHFNATTRIPRSDFQTFDSDVRRDGLPLSIDSDLLRNIQQRA